MKIRSIPNKANRISTSEKISADEIRIRTEIVFSCQIQNLGQA